jgi:hypothetical protein
MPDNTALLLEHNFDTVFAHEYAWKVLAQKIAARNYKLDCKNPYEVAVNHCDLQELMGALGGQ